MESERLESGECNIPVSDHALFSTLVVQDVTTTTGAHRDAKSNLPAPSSMEIGGNLKLFHLPVTVVAMARPT